MANESGPYLRIGVFSEKVGVNMIPLLFRLVVLNWWWYWLMGVLNDSDDDELLFEEAAAEFMM